MMRQSQIAEGLISKLRHTLAKWDAAGDSLSEVEVILTSVADALREQHRYIQMVERKCEEVEILANRRRFHPF